MANIARVTRADARAVVLTGAYGAGKSAMAAEICHQMASHGVATAAIDLDWLAWVGPDLSTEDILDLRRNNLTAMVANFLDAGVERFAMGGALRTHAHRRIVEQALGDVPLVVVRLLVDANEALTRIKNRDVGSELAELLEDAPDVAHVIEHA